MDAAAASSDDSASTVDNEEVEEAAERLAEGEGVAAGSGAERAQRERTRAQKAPASAGAAGPAGRRPGPSAAATKAAEAYKVRSHGCMASCCMGTRQRRCHAWVAAPLPCVLFRVASVAKSIEPGLYSSARGLHAAPLSAQVPPDFDGAAELKGAKLDSKQDAEATLPTAFLLRFLSLRAQASALLRRLQIRSDRPEWGLMKSDVQAS